jgi:hypothetical protein
MRGIPVCQVAFAGLVALLCPPAADAAQHSGTVVAVVPASEADGTTGRRLLTISGAVFQGDVVNTSSGGQTQIRLDDNTKLVVGPNSRLVIDEYVYAGSGSAAKVSLSAIRGAFRFITGLSDKEAYLIKTPTATIGVRGTEFDFSVNGRGGFDFALFSGEARICQAGRPCVVVRGACSVVAGDRGQPVHQLASADRLRTLAAKFPYVASQASLRGEFRVDTSSCAVRRAELPTQSITGSITPINVPPGAPPPVPPPPPPGPANHNGFADGTNPGQGALHNNSPSGGSQNPGGGGGGSGG